MPNFIKIGKVVAEELANKHQTEDQILYIGCLFNVVIINNHIYVSISYNEM